MAMKFKLIALVVGLSVLSFVTFSLYISVDISGNIKADTNYINHQTEIDKQPINLLFNLENIGSVTCESFYKVDFKKNNETIYTAWSKKDVVKPGDLKTFNVYWNPTESGEIKVYPKLYMCDDIYELNETSINVKNILNYTTNFIDVKYKNTNNSIKFYLKSNKSKEVFIIPDKYPQGWRFYPVKTKLEANKKKVVEMKFDTPFFYETPIKFNIVSADGEINDFDEVELKNPKWYDEIDIYKIGFYILLLIVIMELLIIFRGHKFISRRVYRRHHKN